eukprot:1659714-Rhodomonas_salina.1
MHREESERKSHTEMKSHTREDPHAISHTGKRRFNPGGFRHAESLRGAAQRNATYMKSHTRETSHVRRATRKKEKRKGGLLDLAAPCVGHLVLCLLDLLLKRRDVRYTKAHSSTENPH